jgi:hypothetical protein
MNSHSCRTSGLLSLFVLFHIHQLMETRNSLVNFFGLTFFTPLATNLEPGENLCICLISPADVAFVTVTNTVAHTTAYVHEVAGQEEIDQREYFTFISSNDKQISIH